MVTFSIMSLRFGAELPIFDPVEYHGFPFGKKDSEHVSDVSFEEYLFYSRIAR